MTIEAATEPVAYRTLKLPPFGTFIPRLGGVFWALMRAKPGSGQEDYPLIVPEGPEFQLAGPWGSEGKDEPESTCLWDGMANTRAMAASANDHPWAKFASELSSVHRGLPELYVPSVREAHALFAVGCTAFDPTKAHWTSTQFDRYHAYYQYFDDGSAYIHLKSWEGAVARLVRRSSIESLID